MDSREFLMDSREELNADGHRLHMATENSNTIALQNRRARRVSFAETTSVHFFDRDEEYNETTPRKTAELNANSAGELGSDVKPESYKGLGGEDDVGDNIDDEDDAMEKSVSFLRPISSPSPGGSTFGSASSNDEDNFFGPVSANFIRPGRLSDSAASDDNHDVTMDSTAFSMHYRSLAKSDSGADLKTPSGNQNFLEEKTPINANPGRSMTYTLDKKAIPESFISTSEVSGGHSSSDMSLVVENPNKYEYEKLSPGLDAILAESRKTLLTNSAPDDVVTSMPNHEGDVLPSADCMYKLASLTNDVRKGTGGINSSVMLNGDESASEVEFTGTNGLQNTSPSGHSTEIIAPSKLGEPAGKTANILPYHLSKNESHTPYRATISPVLLAATSPSKHLHVMSPLLNETGSFLRNERDCNETSIQKSILKLELLEKSASSSAFSAKVDRSTIKALFNHDSILERLHHVSESMVDNSVAEVKINSNHEPKSRSHAFSIESMRVKHETTDTSPPVTAWSENNLIRSLFTTRPSSEDAIVVEIESSTKIASEGLIKVPEVVSSPHRTPKRLSLPSTSLQSGQSNDFLLQESKQGSEFEKGQEKSKGLRKVLTSPFGGGNHLKNIAEIKTTDNGIVDTYDRKELFRNLDKTISHFKENMSLVSHPGTMDVCSQTSMAISMVENNMNGGQLGTIPHGTISPYGSRILDGASLEKNLMKIPTTGPSRNELDSMHAFAMRPSETIQLSGRRDNLCSSKKNLDLSRRVTHRKNEITNVERSPKRQKVDDCEQLCPAVTLAGQSNRFLDVYSKNLDDMKFFISESAVGLHSKMIDAMEDILASQQRSKMYEMFHHKLMSQNAIVPHDRRHEQIAETNSLLHRVVFEKMKLQLKHVKKERLLKRLQLLNSGIQESQVLRANIMSHPFMTSTGSPTADAVGYPALSVKLKKGPEEPTTQFRRSAEAAILHASIVLELIFVDDRVSYEKLTSMSYSLEALEMEISSLTKRFHELCKLEGRPSSGGIIAALNQHLIKRASCRLLRSDMQMWVLNSLTSSSDQHNVTLSYFDLVTQRIQVMGGPRLSAKTSFVWNEETIMKNFPNMDACTAFAFLFHAETVHELFDSRTSLWETQVTSSLLGTLLDVIAEVQLAQMELANLVQSRFCSPAGEQLHLVLCFFNFTSSGRKVTLTLDMTCLKRGIYPSEIVPLEVKCSSSASIIDELKEEVKTVETGYMRILRLCRFVSQCLK